MTPVRVPIVFCGVLFVAVAAAGCIGGGEGAGTGATGGPGDVSFDEATGAVEGAVVDDEARPVAGALVALVDLPEHQATTDEAGAFVLANVPPGTHVVAGQKLGYDSSARSVSVVAGEVARVQLALSALAIREAYHESWVETGYFECSWSVFIARGPCFFPGPEVLTENNKRQFDYVVGEGGMTVMVEMTWDQTTRATGEAMSLFLSYTDRSTQHWYCNAESPSPVILRWERDADDEEDGQCLSGDAQLPSDEPQAVPMEGQELTSRANGGASDTVPNPYGFGLGLALQQSFDVYFSNFYWEPAPPDFSAIEDA